MTKVMMFVFASLFAMSAMACDGAKNKSTSTSSSSSTEQTKK